MTEEIKKAVANPIFNWIGWISVGAIATLFITIGGYKAGFEQMQEDITAIKNRQDVQTKDIYEIKKDVAVLTAQIK